ncbi:hypothetical protein F2P81_009860 [Scophthalmus maximus]|uniref:Reticulon n=1 Tax=Scophthalmus maximus TaxID=52904 RepID=A0A6A4SPE9_SCOMX|nr:hypothetical protein F2P81_009860 [Scophthalmus maximus]
MSAVAFGLSFLVLVSVATLSIISVVSYLLLACLCVTITFRVYKAVIQAVQKSDDGHPFRSLLERDISVSSESVRLLTDQSLIHLNWFISQSRRLLLVQDLVDSLKLAAVMWLMTYIGSVFNGVTIMILADIMFFTTPLIYQKKKNVALLRCRLEETLQNQGSVVVDCHVALERISPVFSCSVEWNSAIVILDDVAKVEQYFTSRLKDPPVDSSTNQTEAAGERRSVLEAKFNNVMTLCAMLPLLICTCLNSFLHTMISQRLRVMGSLLIIMFVFIITSVLVKVPLEPLTFFSVTMVKIIVINSFGAVLQGSLFGMAGLLPASYTTPIMSGQGLAGTFAAFAMICAIASGSELHDAAFGYFITACFVIFLSLLSYMLLPKLEFFQFYRDRNRKQRRDDDNSVNLMNKDSKEETAAQSGGQNVSMMKIFKKVGHTRNINKIIDYISFLINQPQFSIDLFSRIWLLALSVCFTFTVTIGIYPAVTADTKSTLADGDSWGRSTAHVVVDDVFIDFLILSMMVLVVFLMWEEVPQKDSVLLPVSIMCRLLFVPLFMLCNVQPRVLLPIFFHHDGFFIVFMIFFAFSNGYLASLCMCYGPKNVLPHEAETAGTIMAFFLSLGLALGAALSFVFRALV